MPSAASPRLLKRFLNQKFESSFILCPFYDKLCAQVYMRSSSSTAISRASAYRFYRFQKPCRRLRWRWSRRRTMSSWLTPQLLRMRRFRWKLKACLKMLRKRLNVGLTPTPCSRLLRKHCSLCVGDG